MILPALNFPRPSDFVCRKCLESSGIMGQISIRKSSPETILKDLAVRDVIGGEKALRRKAIRKCKDLDRAAHVI